MDGAGRSGTTGAVLDPIFALRTRIRLGRDGESVAFTTLVATTQRAFELGRYHDSHARSGPSIAWTTSQVSCANSA
jgi:cyclic beta-1,2-glucan synthetase